MINTKLIFKLNVARICSKTHKIYMNRNRCNSIIWPDALLENHLFLLLFICSVRTISCTAQHLFSEYRMNSISQPNKHLY